MRIGLHTGKALGEVDPTTRRTNYFGNTVNYATLLHTSLAEGGEIVMSDACKLALDDVPPSVWSSRGHANMVVTDKGKKKLPGTKGSSNCYRVVPHRFKERSFDQSLAAGPGDSTERSTWASELVKAPKGTITLAFTDIQGSTMLGDHFGEKVDDETGEIVIPFKTLLNLHNAIMRDVLAKYNGYEVKTEGDAFMVAFQEAHDALSFALEAQARMYDAHWPDWLLNDPVLNDSPVAPKETPDKTWRGLRVRIGLHTGQCLGEVDPTTKRTDHFG